MDINDLLKKSHLKYSDAKLPKLKKDIEAIINLVATIDEEEQEIFIQEKYCKLAKDEEDKLSSKEEIIKEDMFEIG